MHWSSTRVFQPNKLHCSRLRQVVTALQRAAVLERLTELSREVPENGLLLVSFSGHGIERDGQGFLLTSDTRFHNDLQLLQETTLSVKTLRQMLSTAHAHQVVLFLGLLSQ